MKRRWRFDLGSWGTFGQMALLILATLLLAQVITFLLFRTVVDQWRSTTVVEPAVTRFAEVAQQASRISGDARAQFLSIASGGDQQYRLRAFAAFPQSPRSKALAQSLEEALRKRGVVFLAVRAFMHGGFGGPPPVPGDGMHRREGPRPGTMPPPRDPRFHSFPYRPEEHGPRRDYEEVVFLAARLSDGNWLTGRILMRRPHLLLLNPIVISESVLFVALLGISLFWASRIAKPMRRLARAAENLRPQDAFTPIPEKGPRDIRTAIASFNAMAGRVRDMVQEKDRMLSAIGHDLRTPLASLRLRAEGVEPAAERERIIETIGEMTQMVDEILGLARLGHTEEPRLPVDLSALADALVEEYRDLGKDVTFGESPRMPVTMQAAQVRRLLRNLIDNAVKYGERARVSVAAASGTVRLCVEDDGPGIPPESLDEVLQPFTRLEQSRSRETGGIGLGLSIADAIARSQGARLVLENRPSGGLRASVQWPATPQPQPTRTG